MMKKTPALYQRLPQALLIAGFTSCALMACSDDPPPGNGSAGASTGGSTAGTTAGGPSTSAGTTNSAGTATAGTSNAGTTSAGTANGGSAGGGGSANAGTTSGGSAGSGGGSAGSSGSGGSGGEALNPTAVFDITGLMGKAVTGTATFTQGATMTTLVLNLTACPNGPHASHLHTNKTCGAADGDGSAAGGHWLPNGEGIPDYTCENTKGTITFMKPTSMWTVGDSSATDVTKYSFMVHEMGGTNPGGRIGCGVAK